MWLACAGAWRPDKKESCERFDKVLDYVESSEDIDTSHVRHLCMQMRRMSIIGTRKYI